MARYREAAQEDLTARARIRDAAIQLMAERGIAGATIRDIAEAAGVSSGLVRHHFGSKEALRDACDTYANERLDRLREEMFTEGKMADVAFLNSVNPWARVLQRYLVKSMMDGSEAAQAMFLRMVDIAEEWTAKQGVRPTDSRAYAAVICAMQMGVFLMHDQLSRVLGVDIDTTEGYVRVNHGMLDAATFATLTPDQAAQLHAALDGLLQNPSSTTGAPDAARTKE
ncbi:MAG: TetR/AcrR family transcriptional regulator [Hamadaea sp.]|nr:TetR/AcrR family transcriptional regulator [Hamadaea sp.]